MTTSQVENDSHLFLLGLDIDGESIDHINNNNNNQSLFLLGRVGYMDQLTPTCYILAHVNRKVINK